MLKTLDNKTRPAETEFVNKTISMTASQSVNVAKVSEETGVPQSIIIGQAFDRYFAECEKEQLATEAARNAAR